MSEQQVFQAPNLRLDHLAQAIGDWYRAQKFDVQALPVPGEGMVVQAKQQEGWRNALGMSSTLNIGLRYKESTLIVEIGAGKWADKAIAGGVGALLVWPLFFTAAYGAWKQSTLPRQTFEFIQAFIGGAGPQNPYQNPYQNQSQNPPSPPPPPSAVPPSTAPPRPDQAPTKQTARRFCENCGSPV